MKLKPEKNNWYYFRNIETGDVTMTKEFSTEFLKTNKQISRQEWLDEPIVRGG